MCRVVPQMHRLLLNNEHTELVNALLEGGTRTALHVAVERSNEAAVALLLAQCVLRARAHAAASSAPALVCSEAPNVPRRAFAPRSKADATTPDADGKSAVELAFDRDAQGILKLLTDPKAVVARMVDVQALMKREVQGNWAKNRRFSLFGCVKCHRACVHTRRARVAG